MKFLRSTILLALAVATAAVARADANVPGARVAYEAGLLLESDESAEAPANYFLRRALQSGSGTGTTSPPPTTPPPTTTPPPPTTPPPTTTAPPTTPPPTTTAPPTTTPPPTTPGPTTAVPETTTPKPTDANSTKTPEPTTAGPSTTKPPTGTVSAGGSDGSETGSKDTPTAGTTKPSSANSSGGDAKTETKSSKMSTGTIIGIVGGIVVGVGILAVIAVVLARKRREEDDDPLSPFELSMDKGYNGAPGYGAPPVNQNQNQYGSGTALAYGGARQGNTTNNAAAIGGAAALGAAAGVGAGVMMTTDTPSANADAAGVAYTQFYDPVTSPSSMYHQEQTQSTNYASDLSSARTDPTNTGSNLWMSAMEPKENDVEGTGSSVPPVISLPDDNSSFVSRNSYDELPGSSVDIDQSSVLSGGSDLEKDFPDYEDGSSRGSYEL